MGRRFIVQKLKQDDDPGRRRYIVIDTERRCPATNRKWSSPSRAEAEARELRDAAARKEREYGR